MDIRDNFLRIQDQIQNTCTQCQRNVDDVNLVAVTKTVDVPVIREAIKAGVQIIGENRIQDAESKHQQISDDLKWHFIGHLQTNKVKKALQIFDVIEAVDSVHLAVEIDKQAQLLDRKVDIFIQVNTSGEESKFGIHPKELESFVTQIRHLNNIHISGLMTIGAFLSNVEQVRPGFKKLFDLREQINQLEIIEPIKYLSMGMTNDFPIAIQEGATHVRIGRALFGERKY